MRRIIMAASAALMLVLGTATAQAQEPAQGGGSNKAVEALERDQELQAQAKAQRAAADKAAADSLKSASQQLDAAQARYDVAFENANASQTKVDPGFMVSATLGLRAPRAFMVGCIRPGVRILPILSASVDACYGGGESSFYASLGLSANFMYLGTDVGGGLGAQFGWEEENSFIKDLPAPKDRFSDMYVGVDPKFFIRTGRKSALDLHLRFRFNFGQFDGGVAQDKRPTKEPWQSVYATPGIGWSIWF